jgi:peptidoglycan hydrolase-like protein with peptidoglycan-binding domain
MTISQANVSWGSYKEFEGPVHYGLGKLNLTTFPTPGHRLLDVVTQTEGGSPSAVNAYDRCIISLGLIQWCEAKYFLSSKLLGAIAEREPTLLSPLDAVLKETGAKFAKKTSNNKWRFYLNNDEVDSGIEQQALFFAGANGLKGQWQDIQKLRAKSWVAAFVNTLHQPEAIEAQIEHTAEHMYSFATPAAKAILFSENKPLEGWPGAVQGGFLSFAANLPAVASKQLELAVKQTKAPKWSPDWCIAVLRELTFGPEIAIYPQRYDKIRPKLEQHFGVNLPDLSAELRVWQAKLDADLDPPTKAEPNFQTTEGVQRFLVGLGYDLGNAGPGHDGVDGREGGKTRDAIMTFQRLNGLGADGQVGKRTRQKMLEVFRSGGKLA